MCRMICTAGWVGVGGGMVEARTSTCMVVGGSSGSVADCQPQEIVTLVTGLCGMGHVVQVGGGWVGVAHSLSRWRAVVIPGLVRWVCGRVSVMDGGFMLCRATA